MVLSRVAPSSPEGGASPGAAPAGASTAALFARGFLGLMPLWAGAIPSGLAYGVAARGAGLGPGETQLMSVLVFSAAGQMGAVSLLAGGASVLLLVATVMALNAQLILLSLTVGRQLHLSFPRRLLAAFLLTDGAYGIVAAQGRLTLPALLGAGTSMFLAWNAGTALGAAVGSAVPDPRRYGLDLIVPLSFLAVLVPLVRTRAAVAAALVAAATAALLAQVTPIGMAILGAGLAGSATGVCVQRQDASAARATGDGERTP